MRKRNLFKKSLYSENTKIETFLALVALIIKLIQQKRQYNNKILSSTLTEKRDGTKIRKNCIG